jgi:HD-GYP domain-containing protein (c-di-GMP phosphodiesterase class II)
MFRLAAAGCFYIGPNKQNLGAFCVDDAITFDINLRDAVYSLSDALDLVGVDEVHHGKRVAYMAVEICRGLELNAQAMDDLYHAAMLHDCGVSSTSVHRKLVSELDWEGAGAHCERGFDLLRACPPLQHLAMMVLHHHTHWDQLQTLGLDELTALQTNAIYLADRVDALLAQHRDQLVLAAVEEVRNTISSLTGDYFCPRLVEAFMGASGNEAFWLTLETERMSEYHSGWLLRGVRERLNFDAFRSIADIFSSIVDAKSSFTAEHSRGVARLARWLGKAAGLSEKSCQMLEVAGLLHDLGKLRVPDHLLDKRGELTAGEFLVMEQHSFDTYVILGRIRGLEEVAQWAGSHHERPNGTGYPFHQHGEALGLEPRIITVADVFQALAQNRPYRKALELDEIVAILSDMADREQVDSKIIGYIKADPRAAWEAAMLKDN